MEISILAVRMNFWADLYNINHASTSPIVYSFQKKGGNHYSPPRSLSVSADQLWRQNPVAKQILRFATPRVLQITHNVLKSPMISSIGPIMRNYELVVVRFSF